MEKEIKVSFKTVFGYVNKMKATYDTESKVAKIPYGSEHIRIDLQLVVPTDIGAIKDDVEEHKERGFKYNRVDPNSVELDEVRIDGDHIVLHYTIDTGDGYRRMCVGIEGVLVNNGVHKWVARHHFYSGSVCW